MNRVNIPNQEIFKNALKLNCENNSTKKIKDALKLGQLYQQYVTILRSNDITIDKIDASKRIYQEILVLEHAVV